MERDLAAMMFPEHDKFQPHQEDANTIGQFLEWMNEQGINRMRWDEQRWEEPCPEADEFFFRKRNERCFNGSLWIVSYGDRNQKLGERGPCPKCHGKGSIPHSRETWIHDGRNIQELIADYFGIDYAKFQEEKEELYRAISAVANAPKQEEK